MEDNEIYEDIESSNDITDSGSDVPFGEPSTNEILSEILDAIKGEVEEGEGILEGENITENGSESALEGETFDIPIYTKDNPCFVDYTEIIDYLESKHYATTEDINCILEDRNKSIFDKELNEYTVSETLLLIGVLIILLKFMCESIERFFVKWKL